MLTRINHFWRILATGFCFAFFGLGGVFLAVCIFPLQKIFIRDQAQRKRIARKTVHYAFKWFIALMGYSGVFKFDVKQAQQLKNLQGHLILANHPSLIDVVVLVSIIPNADCVVKAHLFKNPILRGVFKSTGYISNADPEGLLADCDKTLKAGNNLIIFPEGTRTKPGIAINFQRGAANIALRCQAKIAYVLIKVKPTTLTKSEPWYKVPSRRAMFSAQLLAVEEVTTVPVLPPFIEESVSKDVRHYNQSMQDFFIEKLIDK